MRALADLVEQASEPLGFLALVGAFDDIPEFSADVHTELRRRAEAAGMSLSEFALQQLARSVRRPTLSDLLDRAAARSGDRMTFAEAREAVVATRPSE